MKIVFIEWFSRRNFFLGQTKLTSRKSSKDGQSMNLNFRRRWTVQKFWMISSKQIDEVTRGFQSQSNRFLFLHFIERTIKWIRFKHSLFYSKLFGSVQELDQFLLITYPLFDSAKSDLVLQRVEQTLEGFDNNGIIIWYNRRLLDGPSAGRPYGAWRSRGQRNKEFRIDLHQYYPAPF